MTLDDTACYDALTSRDSRFDGVFFVGVTSTGIYCRPICPARTPKRTNCRFFASAEAAEKQSFRPCLRCRPELAPGSAPVDDASRIVHLLTQRIEEGLIDDDARLADIAAQFELGARQIRRIVKKELGVSPVELLRTRRLLLAKQLLTETGLPIVEIAFASGFSSLRRFNHVFGTRYGMPPSRFRKRVADAARPPALSGTATIRLAWRPPYDWDGILAFLGARALAGVERVTEDGYVRTVRLGAHTGWAGVRHAPEKGALLLEFTHALTPVLPALIGRMRSLFDLGARPDIVAGRLMQDSLLKAAVAENPGLRVPGAFDGFEMAVRAILGQQVTVRAATTLGCRFAEAFGEPVETPVAGLDRLSPTAERIARARVDDIAALGIVAARARCIMALAGAFASGGLRLDAGASPDTAIDRLTAIPGIGRWTAQYIAMRALRWPDAFPKEDIALRNRLGGVTASRAEAMSQAWRPWRSYAVLHLWRMPPSGRG